MRRVHPRGRLGCGPASRRRLPAPTVNAFVPSAPVPSGEGLMAAGVPPGPKPREAQAGPAEERPLSRRVAPMSVVPTPRPIPLPLCLEFCSKCGRGWCLPTALAQVADSAGHLVSAAVLLGGRRWMLVRWLDGECRQAQELELEGLPQVGTVED